MTYRFATHEDIRQLDLICARHEIATPTDLRGVMVAVDETDVIIGLIGMKTRLVVEPFISESGNAAVVLWEKMITAAELSGQEILLLSNKHTHITQAEKLGFAVVQKDLSALERKVSVG